MFSYYLGCNKLLVLRQVMFSTNSASTTHAKFYKKLIAYHNKKLTNYKSTYSRFTLLKKTPTSHHKITWQNFNAFSGSIDCLYLSKASITATSNLSARKFNWLGKINVLQPYKRLRINQSVVAYDPNFVFRLWLQIWQRRGLSLQLHKSISNLCVQYNTLYSSYKLRNTPISTTATLPTSDVLNSGEVHAAAQAADSDIALPDADSTATHGANNADNSYSIRGSRFVNTSDLFFFFSIPELQSSCTESDDSIEEANVAVLCTGFSHSYFLLYGGDFFFFDLSNHSFATSSSTAEPSFEHFNSATSDTCAAVRRNNPFTHRGFVYSDRFNLDTLNYTVAGDTLLEYPCSLEFETDFSVTECTAELYPDFCAGINDCWGQIFLYFFLLSSSLSNSRYSSFLPFSTRLNNTVSALFLVSKSRQTSTYHATFKTHLRKLMLRSWLSRNLGFILAKNGTNGHPLSLFYHISCRTVITFRTKFCLLSRRLRKIVSADQKYREKHQHLKTPRKLLVTGAFIKYFVSFAPQLKYASKLRQLLFDVIFKPNTSVLLLARTKQQTSLLSRLLK